MTGPAREGQFCCVLYHVNMSEEFWKNEVLQRIGGEQEDTLRLLGILPVPRQSLGNQGRFAWIEVRTKEMSNTLQHLSGKGGYISWSAPGDSTTLEVIADGLEEMLRSGDLLSDRGELNLSQISWRIENVDFQKLPNVCFLLFYSAVLSVLTEIKVKRLLFENPDIAQTDFLMFAKARFPRLKVIELARQTQVSVRMKETLDKSKVKLIVARQLVWNTCPDKPWERWGWTVPQLPAVAVDGSTPGLHIGMFDSVKFDLSEMKTHSVITEFFACAWENLMDIRRFYSPVSVFSTTVNVHPPGPLTYFERYSRTVDGVAENRLIGSDEIAQGQNEMFRGHFYANPTAFQCAVVGEGLVCYTIQGVFQFDEITVLGFDRTMMLYSFDDKCVITNDHVFIRMPNLK